MKVIKRDGKKVNFDIDRINNAVYMATMSEHGDTNKASNIAQLVTDSVNKKIIEKNLENIHVECIQDEVEECLMQHEPDIARTYIRYRDNKNEQRNQFEKLDRKISGLIDLTDDISKENANKDAKVFNTKRDLLAGAVARDYALRKMLPKEIKDAHLSGDLHFHDLDYSPLFSYTNCMLIDFKEMLGNGFKVGNAQIESPKSIKTATALISQIVANVSSNIYGGTTINHVDKILEPYAQKSYDKYYKQHLERVLDIKTELSEIEIKQLAEQYAKEDTKKEIYDSMQSLEYEINTLYNSNGQTPFFTVGFGLGDTWIAKEIQKSILRIRYRGLGVDKKTAIFPKLVFALKRGHNLNPEDPFYDVKQLALKTATLRMYPDIVSYDKLKEVTGGTFKFPMGCRSFPSTWQNPKTGEYEEDGRGNMGVVTLNIPRISLETDNRDDFFNLLSKRMKIIKKALDYRIDVVKRARPENAPILYKYGATGIRLDNQENVMKTFKNGRATISFGYIGIYEAVAKFYGSDWYDNKEAMAFAIDIMKYMSDEVNKWKEEDGWGYSVYGTPAESLCYRFASIDKEKFGSIENITNKGYYTNSFHVDVRKNINAFDKIDIEKNFSPYSPGGFIHYVEMPNLKNNPNALEDIWDYAYDKVAYYGVNTPIDKCYVCDYEGEFDATSEGFKCPNCGNQDPSKSSCIRRLCGYLGSTIERPVNDGKLKEMQSRVKHN